MATKRELEKQIAELSERLTYLENMHARIEDEKPLSWSFSPLALRERAYCGKVGSYNNRKLTAREVHNVICDPHPFTRERTVSTKNINDITLSELAKFVLDGIPIKRKRSQPVTYESTYTPESVTRSVETELGDITITERID